MKNLLRLLTVLFLVLPLSSLLWNLFELPAVLSMQEDNYAAFQSLGLGLSWLIFFEFGGLVLTIILMTLEKKKKRMYRDLLIAMICFSVSIAIFLIFVLPANITTKNWTLLPGNWDSLREKWEYATAIRAIISLAGFGFVIYSLLQNRNYYRVYSQWETAN